jgi:molecular chaperone DnaK (HSP70)
VTIHVLQGERRRPGNKSLGQFNLEGFHGLRAACPQIEVTF